MDFFHPKGEIVNNNIEADLLMHLAVSLHEHNMRWQQDKYQECQHTLVSTVITSQNITIYA